MYANYHTHTKRCKHASGEDREYVEAAIRAGIQILGFSDHCPWIFPDDFVSHIRMLPSEVDDYFHSLTQLRKEYVEDIQILIGFEAEYVPELMEEQDRFLADYPLDYMILGQHFLGSEEHSYYIGSPTDREEDIKKYVDLVMEGMDSGRYLYPAHPDLVYYTGSDAIYEQHMTRLLEYLRDNGYPIEINMLGAVQGRNYPNNRFLQIASELGNQCIIGVDAHSPEQLEHSAREKSCEKLIETYQLELCEPPLL